jgi:hypothetical protein
VSCEVVRCKRRKGWSAALPAQPACAPAHAQPNTLANPRATSPPAAELTPTTAPSHSAGWSTFGAPTRTYAGSAGRRARSVHAPAREKESSGSRSGTPCRQRSELSADGTSAGGGGGARDACGRSEDGGAV